MHRPVSRRFVFGSCSRLAAGRAPRQLLVELFSKHGITPEILEPEDAGSITTLARDAVRRGFDIIVAGGGDGTVNAVASAVVGHGTKKLGVLPIGTLNHFARDLGIPIELEDAIEVIFAGSERVVDVGEVNGRIFVNNSSVGLYPAIVRLRESLQKSGFGKFPAAVWASLRIVSRFRRLHSVRERHHLHLWTSDLSDDGLAVWVGTAHLDTSANLYRSVTYHRIDPDVDRQRDALAQDLARSNCVSDKQVIDVTSPMRGQNILHNPFFTDGKAIQILLHCH